MEFTYTSIPKENYLLLKLNGNIMEMSQASGLMEEIKGELARNATNFIVDLSGVKYMNSTGLNVLLMILSQSRKAGGEAIICCVPEKIKALLVITKLVSVFSVADSEAAAEKMFINTPN